MVKYNVDEFIPHRDKMKLIDEIIEVDEKKAITLSTVTSIWPSYENDSVNPIVLIELVAQTSGVYIAWQKMQENKQNQPGIGWVMGVKNARFYIDNIPVSSEIQTRSDHNLTFDNYIKFDGKLYRHTELIGEVNLQLFLSNSEFFFKPE